MRPATELFLARPIPMAPLAPGHTGRPDTILFAFRGSSYLRLVLGLASPVLAQAQVGNCTQIRTSERCYQAAAFGCCVSLFVSQSLGKRQPLMSFACVSCCLWFFGSVQPSAYRQGAAIHRAFSLPPLGVCLK